MKILVSELVKLVLIGMLMCIEIGSSKRAESTQICRVDGAGDFSRKTLTALTL